MLTHRSGCPINLSLEVFGDRWTLIVLRDIMFGGPGTYNDLLGNSLEGISSNILADRLRKLLELGMLSKVDDPAHKQRAIYSLTQKSIDLLPIFAMLGAWGNQYLPVAPELAARAHLLEAGGPELWGEFMRELRMRHLGEDVALSVPPVSERLNRAYHEASNEQD